ncbi:hypothetical protein Cpir12675_001992 [Ceratocystis pirilliformis]|uniref:Enoyl reductase (ER) domain-containing protein n=1 Tax=Ceratocystis pirilliformis TaxID=259994 RepID=A0ABR3ZDW6_9PEZI
MTSRVLMIEKTEGKPGNVYYPLRLTYVDIPRAGPGQVVVKMLAASLNHRDLFIRKHLYPAISFASPLFSDGYGTVTEVGPSCKTPSLLGKNVILAPFVNWSEASEGPEDARSFTVIGASKLTPLGTGTDFVVIDEAALELAPEHLSAAEGATIPTVGLTAWRALVTKTNNALPGRNILITGIGGGVAISALQFAAAMGCAVFVTSSSNDKIEKAKTLGAKGGVNYKSDSWVADLQAQLPKDRPYIDAVIDGAGGSIMSAAVKLMKAGGVVASYGMTQGPKMDWLMQAVLKNIDLKGCTMGSRKEYADMMQFIRDKKIVPVVSRVVQGLDNIGDVEGLFRDMDQGIQFGKLVIEFGNPGETTPPHL